MDALATLSNQLHRVNQVALTRLKVGDFLPLLQERSLLQSWVGGGAHRALAENLTMDDALRRFYQRRLLQGVRQIRLVSYACTQTLSPERFCVLEQRNYFAHLLQEVARYQTRKRLLRKFYRGLLNSYFSFDPYSPSVNLAARENWSRLRQFLLDFLAATAGGATPDWLRALQQHANLLQENPGAPYVTAALQGDWSAFNALRERLDIGADSWLVREVVLAPLKAVAALPDADFIDALESALLVLSRHPLYVNDGLPLLLERYYKCKNNQYNQMLMEFSVSKWGNPWLAENRSRWPCRHATRTMLARWLKRYLLTEFFNRLSGESSMQLRRLQFWLLYSADLNGMYFALGSQAFSTNDSALFKFRQLAKGLVAKLAEAELQICILQFPHFHVVALSQAASPAYFYDTRLGTPPFYFGKGWMDIGALNVSQVTTGTEVSAAASALTYQDEASLWEQRFAQKLGMTEFSMQAFCRQYHTRYHDTRSKNSLQVIELIDKNVLPAHAVAVLLGWGFQPEEDTARYVRQSDWRDE